MNTDTFDMSTPVTRGELREEFALFEIRFEQKLDQKLDQRLGELDQKLDQKLDQRLGELEQKFDHKLEFWGGALLARITESERRAQAWNAEALARITESEQRLLTELGRHARAIQEAMTAQISVIDEKYADLPERVRRLEAKVSAPRRR